ncbi:hypothetical protein D3C80_1963690 [compost metagenome]
MLRQVLVAGFFPVIGQIAADNDGSRTLYTDIVTKGIQYFAAVCKLFAIPGSEKTAEGRAVIGQLGRQVMGICGGEKLYILAGLNPERLLSCGILPAA